MAKKKQDEPALTLDSVISAYEKKFSKEGERLIFGGDEIDDPSRLWPGSLELAYAMGGGGTRGRWMRLWGPKSSGKTKTAYAMAASAQRDFGDKVMYINAENQFYQGFATAQGVDVSKDKFKVVNGTKVIESITELIEAAMPHNELFIIDSTSACISAAAKESGIDSERPMMDAKAWTKATQFLNDAHDPLRNTIIFIDQARTGTLSNGMFGGQQPPGGYALDHYSSMTAKFTTAKWLYYKNGFLDDSETNKGAERVSGQTEPDGREMKVRIEKSRVGGQFRTATLWFDLNKGVYEPEFEYFKWAKHFDMLEGGPTWFTVDGEKVQGGQKVKAWIAEHPEFQDEIRKRVLEVA